MLTLTWTLWARKRRLGARPQPQPQPFTATCPGTFTRVNRLGARRAPEVLTGSEPGAPIRDGALRIRQKGPTSYNLSKAALMELVLSLPPLPEQVPIASVLSDMDAEIDALEAKLAKAKQIKQGMMQELLTGRIRLV